MNRDDDLFLWLEDLGCQQVIDWASKQNQLTKEYIEKIPFKPEVQGIMKSFANRPKFEIGISNVCVHGIYAYYVKNEDLESNGKLFRINVDTGVETQLADPFELSGHENSFLYLTSISNDGRYVGFTLHKGGGDWCQLRVVDINNGNVLQDIINVEKLSSIEFFEEGFFYSAYEMLPNNVPASLKSQKNHRLFYHRLGTDPATDAVVLDKDYVLTPECNNMFDQQTVFWSTVLEGRFLVVRCVGKTILWICKDLLGNEDRFKVLFETRNEEGFALAGSIDGRAYFSTFKDAPNGQVLSVNLNSTSFNSIVVIPERENVIKNVTCDCGKIFVTYLEDVKTSVHQFDADGNPEHEVKMPFICCARTSSGMKSNGFTVFEIESFISPKSLYKVDPKAGTCKPLMADSMNSDDYEIRQEFYESFDGVRVPMFIIGKKGKLGDKPRIVMLNGYGAANVSNTPFYSYLAMTLIELGGIYAVANIRGGGEYGFNWYRAGIRENRENCFRDFICGAQYLISQGYASKNSVSAYGGSNGGTMVAACMNMRPDLFKVVIANSGLHDMLRFHQFGFGSSWINEYGNPDLESDRDYLKRYSPVHNIKPNVSYPAVMATVCENDDRVAPIHSYKLIEALRKSKVCGGPYLLRIQKNGGHLLRKLSSQIDEFSDILCFVLIHCSNSHVS